MNTFQVPVCADPSSDLARWQAAVNRTQISVQTHPMGEVPFSGTLADLHLGAVVLRHFRSTPVLYIRGEREIDLCPGNMFEVSFTLSGRTVIGQDGRQIVQNPGDIVLFDPWRPFDYFLPEGDDQLVLDIPRSLLEQYLPHADAYPCSVLGSASRFGRLVGKMFEDITTQGPAAPDSVAARLGTAVVDVVAMAFDVEFGSKGRLRHERPQLCEKVRKFILNSLSDPSLDVETIAHANNMSPRSLHRMFAAQETTVMRWLWNQRLCASYKALATGQGRRVSDVAVSCGFTNFSHFARSFKQTFGILPQALLRSRSG